MATKRITPDKALRRKGLITEDERAQFSNMTMDAAECFEYFGHRLFDVIQSANSHDDPAVVGLDDVARHLILCNRAREDARKLLAMADKIEEAVYEDLVPIHEHEGRMPSIPTFDGWGSRNMGPDGGLSEQAYERYITGEVEVSA